jgi:Sec-independent protein translocase protein TatA
MIWLEVLAIVVVALVILGLSAFSVLRRLPALGQAMRRLQRRQQDAEVLQMAVAHLQERLQATSEHAAAVAEHAAEVRAKAATLRPGGGHR